MGVHCINTDGIGGLLGNLLQSGLATDDTWKCSNTYTPYWSSAIFDDATWAEAYVITKNDGLAFWDAVAGIDSGAEWIWTSNWQGGDTEVWCRKAINTSGYCNRLS